MNGQSRFWSQVNSRLLLLAVLVIVIIVSGVLAGFSLLTQQQADDSHHNAQNSGQVNSGVTRQYYIASDEVDWDYAPLNKDNITGRPFSAEARVFVTRGADTIGRVYRKAIYREYTDATFKTLKPVPTRWQHLGILGPVIRAEVGDTIIVHYKNQASRLYSIHVHGVFYTKDSEGAFYNDGTSGSDKTDDAVPPGGKHDYVWQVTERAGPGPGDLSSMLWMYHSHYNEPKDENSGLIGPLIISARGTTKPDGTPNDVDREFVSLFKIFDENDSYYLNDNVERFIGKPKFVDPDKEVSSSSGEEAEGGEFHESNLKHSINGYLYGNLSDLTMRRGEKVRWYVMTMGTEVDLHTPHWHGQTLLMNGMMRVDTTELLPASMKVLDMVPDSPGTWLFHCHVNDHIKAGMQALYTIMP